MSLKKPLITKRLSNNLALVFYLQQFNFRMKNRKYLIKTEKVTEFLGTYGIATNGLSFVFALVGSSFFIRRFGLTTCLVLYPLMIAGLCGYVWAFPTLWAFFVAQVATKALSYALNNPCKEIMYIPTSKDVKFKAKSWVDSFGSRSAKCVGASIAAFFPAMADLAAFAPVISLGVIGFWIPVALFVGRSNNKLVKENKIIE
jgi:AAA family ATP:ADP antiporter